MNIKIKTLPHFKGELPKYQTPDSSGFDIRAQISSDVKIESGERKLISTGIRFETPHGYELQVRPRSGLALQQGITVLNTPGTIDADFRGEVMIILINHGKMPYTIRDQDRVAQLVLCPIIQASFELVEDLPLTRRNTGGFGSTGM